MTTYTEKRFFKWYEDEISVSLRAKSGSYGGGSEVFILYTPERISKEQQRDKTSDRDRE